MSETDPALADLADGLYALPLAEFTTARDAAARAAGTGPDGDRALAAQIKGLKKPSLAAWVVNHFVRRDADQVAEILTIAESLRAAQQAMDGEELRQLTRQRRQLTAAVTTRARVLATEYGVRVTESVAEQVEATITAALLEEQAAAAMRTGMLVKSLSSVGFRDSEAAGAVAIPQALGTVPSATPPEPPRPELHVVPDLDEELAAREEREAALARAQEWVNRAREQHTSALTRHAKLQAKLLQNASRLDELRRQLAEAESTQERLEDDQADTDQALAAAEEEVRRAESDRDDAAKALGGGGSD